MFPKYFFPTLPYGHLYSKLKYDMGLEFDIFCAKSGWQEILSKNVEQQNYNSNPLFRLGYSPSSPFIFQVHCFQDFSRLGKSLSTLWSIRLEQSEEGYSKRHFKSLQLLKMIFLLFGLKNDQLLDKQRDSQSIYKVMISMSMKFLALGRSVRYLI